MNGLVRFKAVPWVLGVCLVAASLIGANRLLHPTSAASPGHAPADKSASPELKGGVILLGHVDADPAVVPVGPPISVSLALVDKVLVAEGDHVKPGQALVQFDDSLLRPKLQQAQAALAQAVELSKKAELQKQSHAIDVSRQQGAIQAAEQRLKLAEDSLRSARENAERLLNTTNPITNRPYTPAEKARRLREDPDLAKLEGLVIELRAKAEDERKKLQALAVAGTAAESDIRAAAEKVKQAQGAVAEAQAAIDACRVTAKVAGVVEQVAAVAGMTYGPTSRAPLMLVVPAKGRVVRAEVEPEFASKLVGAEGKHVKVYDHNNFALVYDGVVRRVSTAFLPKRGSGEALVASPTRVLECLIDLPDPNPPGQPPLRVGQPVRVSFSE
jgi:multidrug resistance efflux pump